MYEPGAVVSANPPRGATTNMRFRKRKTISSNQISKRSKHRNMSELENELTLVVYDGITSLPSVSLSTSSTMEPEPPTIDCTDVLNTMSLVVSTPCSSDVMQLSKSIVSAQPTSSSANRMKQTNSEFKCIATPKSKAATAATADKTSNSYSTPGDNSTQLIGSELICQTSKLETITVSTVTEAQHSNNSYGKGCGETLGSSSHLTNVSSNKPQSSLAVAVQPDIQIQAELQQETTPVSRSEALGPNTSMTTEVQDLSTATISGCSQTDPMAVDACSSPEDVLSQAVSMVYTSTHTDQQQTSVASNFPEVRRGTRIRTKKKKFE